MGQLQVSSCKQKCLIQIILPDDNFWPTAIPPCCFCACIRAACTAACADLLSHAHVSKILFTCGAHTAGTSSDTFCQGKTGQFYADPCDCTKFVQCANGVTYLQSCASGLTWSESSLWCVTGSCTTSTPASPPVAPSPVHTASPAVPASPSPSSGSTTGTCPTGDEHCAQSLSKVLCKCCHAAIQVFSSFAGMVKCLQSLLKGFTKLLQHHSRHC